MFAIFGVSDWAARLPSAVDTTLMVIAIYWFLRKFRPGFHLDGALLTAAAAGVIGFARAASTDTPLAATFTLAMLAWYAWHESGAKAYLALSYAALALGALAKGPVAPFLALAILVVFAAAQRDYRMIRRTLWIPGILLFCAIALPWYIAVQMRNPEFFRVFILEHNLARFGTNLYRHKEPFWYYIPVVLLGLVPWAVFAIAALVETVRAWWAERREVFQPEDALNIFLVIWLVVPAAFFSISQSKLPGYILPALPAGTVLVAEHLRRRLTEGDRPGILMVSLHSILAAAPMVPALMIQSMVLYHRLSWSTATAISCAAAAVLAIGIAVTLRAQFGPGALRLVAMVPVVLIVAAVLRLGAPALDSALSARPLALEISRMESTRLPLAVFRVPRQTEYGLAFYRDQAIDRYESGRIPAGEHLVVAPKGSQTEVAQQVEGRRVSYLGSFAPQGLDYYWVAAQKSGQ